MAKNYKDMTRSELITEIERVKTAITNTKSYFVIRDYKKYLLKLTNERKYKYGN